VGSRITTPTGNDLSRAVIIVRGEILTFITEKEIVFGSIIVNGDSHLTFTALWFRIFCVPQFRSEVGIPSR
jgi:hypothetical protein